jgi:hypothetical protein
VTITYPNGAVLEAIVLSNEESEIRAIAPGCNDVLIFTRVQGTWISEYCEPVAIEFAWQRHGKSPSASVEDSVCSKDLAARLIGMLFRGGDPDEAGEAVLSVVSPENRRVAIH